MDLGLRDKVTIVTGGGAGIGGAITLGLAAEGAIPVIFGRSPLTADFAGRLRDRSPRAKFVQVNLEDDDACKAAVEETIGAFGRIDHLVNNAGVGGTAPLLA
ncbi:SDR family NAD(P)-dependent oxidoreductase, partial [Rhizobiaceae sp. 2RAB30]